MADRSAQAKRPPGDDAQSAPAAADYSDDSFIHSAFSLPHGFRFSGAHGDSLSRVRRGAFFARAPAADDASPVPAVDSATAKTRLEVLHAWEVNFTILSLYVASFSALIYVFFALGHVRAVWFSSSIVPPASIVEFTLAPVLRTAAAVLPVLFVLRVVAHGQATHEQLWTGALLAVGTICSNPLTLAAERSGDKGSAPYVALVVNDAVYTAASYLYLLLSAHSYRILDNNALHSRSLYAKKLAVVFLYFLVKLITGFGAHVVLGLVPFARILAWFILVRSGRFSARVAVPVLLTTALDTLLTLWLLREVALTARFLARKPYLEHRAKQLGFRCFVYQSMVFCVSIVFLAAVAILRLPREILFRNFDDADANAFLQLETPAGHLGLAFVYLTWTVVLAYVNLPPGPMLPYTGQAVSRFLQALPSSAPVAWLRAQGVPLPLPMHVDDDVVVDIENPPQTDLDPSSTQPLVLDETVPLRYRHREWFVNLEDDRDFPSASPFSLAQVEAKRNTFIEQRHLDVLEMEKLEQEKLQKVEEDAGACSGIRGEENDDIKVAKQDDQEDLDDFAVPGFLHYPQYRPVSTDGIDSEDEEDEMADDEEVDEEGESETREGVSMAESVRAPNNELAVPVPLRPARHSGLGNDYGMTGCPGLGYPGGPRPSHIPFRESFMASEKHCLPELGRVSESYLLSENHRLSSSTIFPESFPQLPISVRRLQLRKNLFVMETQVFLAQAAYLSYIPGNAREERAMGAGTPSKPPSPHERPSLHHTSSLSTDLEGLARRVEQRAVEARKGDSGNSDLSQPPLLHRVSSVPLVPDLDEGADPNRQPSFDDGTRFRVDPEQLARDHGYLIFRQISNLQNNTHATVLLGKDRVVVAFSGTRDARNWATNTKIRRSVFDELFPEFEYEIAPDFTHDQRASGSRYPRVFVPPSECKSSVIGVEGMQKQRKQVLRTGFRSSLPRGSSKPGSLRRSHSTDSLLQQSQLSWESATDSTCDSESPIRRGWALYGALGRPPLRFTFRERDAGRDGGKPRRTASQRVKVVATTIAHEFMTIGQAKVHDGFANAYLSLRKQVMGALVELYGGETRGNSEEAPTPPLAHGLPLFLCGHSLGGALATFASFEAAKYFRQIGMHHRQDISCTTFGCPMVGNDVFKTRYERLVETHWRFEMASDPVPKLPSLFLNYTHVGVRVLLDQSGMLLIDPSFIEVHWWGKLSGPYLGYRLHSRASYITALRLYCDLYKDGRDNLDSGFWLFPIKVQTKGIFLLPSK